MCGCVGVGVGVGMGGCGCGCGCGCVCVGVGVCVVCVGAWVLYSFVRSCVQGCAGVYNQIMTYNYPNWNQQLEHM